MKEVRRINLSELGDEENNVALVFLMRTGRLAFNARSRYDSQYEQPYQLSESISRVVQPSPAKLVYQTGVSKLQTIDYLRRNEESAPMVHAPCDTVRRRLFTLKQGSAVVETEEVIHVTNLKVNFFRPLPDKTSLFLSHFFYHYLDDVRFNVFIPKGQKTLKLTKVVNHITYHLTLDVCFSQDVFVRKDRNDFDSISLDVLLGGEPNKIDKSMAYYFAETYNIQPETALFVFDASIRRMICWFGQRISQASFKCHLDRIQDAPAYGDISCVEVKNSQGESVHYLSHLALGQVRLEDILSSMKETDIDFSVGERLHFCVSLLELLNKLHSASMMLPVLDTSYMMLDAHYQAHLLVHSGLIELTADGRHLNYVAASEIIFSLLGGVMTPSLSAGKKGRRLFECNRFIGICWLKACQGLEPNEKQTLYEILNVLNDPHAPHKERFLHEAVTLMKNMSQYSKDVRPPHRMIPHDSTLGLRDDVFEEEDVVPRFSALSLLRPPPGHYR